MWHQAALLEVTGLAALWADLAGTRGLEGGGDRTCVHPEGFCGWWEGVYNGEAPSPASLWLEEGRKHGISTFPALARGLLVPSATSDEGGLAAHRLCFPFSLSAARLLVPPSKICPSLHSRPSSTPAESMTSTKMPSSLTG